MWGTVCSKQLCFSSSMVSFLHCRTTTTAKKRNNVKKGKNTSSLFRLQPIEWMNEYLLRAPKSRLSSSLSCIKFGLRCRLYVDRGSGIEVNTTSRQTHASLFEHFLRSLQALLKVQIPVDLDRMLTIGVSLIKKEEATILSLSSQVMRIQ